MKKLILVLLIIFYASTAGATQYTANYNLGIPAQASRDILPQISADIVSIDAIMNMLSEDSAWIDGGTVIYPRTITDNVGIATLTPTVSLDVAGEASVDAIHFSAEARPSQDVVGGSPILIVSKDTDGTNYLNFYNGSDWFRVTTE